MPPPEVPLPPLTDRIVVPLAEPCARRGTNQRARPPRQVNLLGTRSLAKPRSTSAPQPTSRREAGQSAREPPAARRQRRRSARKRGVHLSTDLDEFGPLGKPPLRSFSQLRAGRRAREPTTEKSLTLCPSLVNSLAPGLRRLHRRGHVRRERPPRRTRGRPHTEFEPAMG